jgi:acyl dehydratase
MPRYFDDLHVGETFVSSLHTVDADSIIRFAREFDPQPFHVDPVAARASFFGQLAASGWHTGAITMRLLVDGELQLAGGMIGGGGELVWPRPVFAGDTLQVYSEVVEMRPSRSHPERGTVLLRSETRNQHGDPVQILTAKLVVLRKPAAP